MRTGPFSDAAVVNIINRYFVAYHMDNTTWSEPRARDSDDLSATRHRAGFAIGKKRRACNLSFAAHRITVFIPSIGRCDRWPPEVARLLYIVPSGLTGTNSSGAHAVLVASEQAASSEPPMLAGTFRRTWWDAQEKLATQYIEIDFPLSGFLRLRLPASSRIA